MQFLYPALTWGFLLALVPLLIHLINMMRHKRVKWAAMDFLLQAYKKHRKWVWLKQLILLLMRMAAVAIIVAMLAQWITRGQFLDLLGGKTTHHYVLIDDSMSMSDRASGTRAFDRAMRFMLQLGSEAADQGLPQRFTLIRYSRAALAEGDDQSAPSLVADLNAEDVDTDFGLVLETKRTMFEVTELASDARPALDTARQLINLAPDENRVVYVVSDFRAAEWSSPSELKRSLEELEKSGAKIHLVNCVTADRSNLAIVDIAPAAEIRAAGVPLFMNVSIKNFGTAAVEKIPLKIRTRFFDPDAEIEDQPRGEGDELPVVQIESIGPGKTVTQRVQVYFPKPGRHTVEAILPEDPVAADNRRWCVIDFPEGEPVLVVDGDEDQINSFFLRTIFQPGQRTNTGIRPDFQPATFLRDASPETLYGYGTIYLFDLDRLDDRAVSNLEAYVRRGGGLAVFVGQNVNVSFYSNMLYRDAQGLTPVPLVQRELLPPNQFSEEPDVLVLETDHPVFKELTAAGLMRTLKVDQFFSVPDEWQPPTDSTIRVVARLRNNAPLIVEKTLGDGRVMMFLTTYAPQWNDLALGPNVLMALRLQSYLGSSSRPDRRSTVGQEIRLELSSEQYNTDVKFFTPTIDPEVMDVIDRPADRAEVNSPVLIAGLRSREVKRSGVYEAWATTTEGKLDPHRYAVNVDNRESGLARVSSPQLIERLDPVELEIHDAESYQSGAIQQAGFNRSMLLMCLLVGLLIGEQLMAFSASYHPPRGAVR